MSLDDRILDCLARLEPCRASVIADELAADLLDVQLRLGLMLGSRVARDEDGCWRLRSLPATTSLANMTVSVCAVVKGLADQARAGV